MRLISMHVREFGGLVDRHFSFTDGLNLIVGDNESGKSTLMLFLRFVLYGLPKKAAGEALSDGERAYSWANGVADGSLTVSHAGKIYRIERREAIGCAKRAPQIIDEESGLQVHKGEVPGEVFLGFPLEVFDSTACIRQLRSGQIHGDGLSEAIENLLLSGDESIDADRALNALDLARRTLKHKRGNGGEIPHLRDTQATVRARIVEMERNAEALRTLHDEREALEEERVELEGKQKELERYCRAAEDAAVLSRFDHLRRMRDEAREKETALSSLMRSGRIYDADFARRLSDAADALEASDREMVEATADLRVAEHMPSGDAELSAFSEKLRRAGGEAAVREELTMHAEALSAAEAKKKRFLTAAIAVGAASVLGGIFLWPLFLLLLLSGVAVLGALSARRAALAAASRLDALAASLGLPAGGRDAMLKALSVLVLRSGENERQIAAREEKITLATLRVERATAREGNARAEAERLALPLALSRVSADALRRAAERISADLHEKDRLSSELEIYSRTCERLAGELQEFNEEEIRGRMPADFGAAIGDYDPSSCRMALKEVGQSLLAINDDRIALERRISTAEAMLESPEELQREYEALSVRISALEAKHRAIVLAYSSIEAAREQLASRVNPRLRQSAARYLSTLTDGRYDALALDSDYLPSAESVGGIHPSEAFSGGTKDALYLSLRLALTDLLSGKEPMPILLDEALAQLDDKRATALLTILLHRAEEGGQQSLLFTCHSREERLLEGQSYHKIEL